jgi:hypothetical protein
VIVMTVPKLTREAWLHAAIDVLRPRFVDIEMPLPDKIYISVGFGYGAKRESAKVLGQCWARSASDDGVNHIFISPEVNDTVRVLDILIHELIHAADDCRNGHKGPFARAAKAVGLQGRMTTTTAGVVLAAEMTAIAASLGEYAHAALHTAPTLTPAAPGEPEPESPSTTPTHSGPGTQTTRLIKVECACCGYTVRTTAKWLALGNPRCPEGDEMTQTV